MLLPSFLPSHLSGRYLLGCGNPALLEPTFQQQNPITDKWTVPGSEAGKGTEGIRESLQMKWVREGSEGVQRPWGRNRLVGRERGMGVGGGGWAGTTRGPVRLG